MFITQDTMERLHDVQFDMLNELIRVMDILHIEYYFVHGSLLGAVRDNDFIAEDDDIDIGIMREDYNRLLLYGQAIIDTEYFIQSASTDGYPLPFAKLRKNDTAFIQPVLKNVDCHKGIYIDIFPIDYESDSKFFRIKKLLLDYRIRIIFPNNRLSFKGKILQTLPKIIYFNYSSALLKREVLFSSAKKSKYVTIYGGKPSEGHMPVEWFEQCWLCDFRGIKVKCPMGYREYLKRIYGDEYMLHNPAEERIFEKEIEVSADILDFERSYLDYC